jgi:lipopolysaccharide transport system permease protein
MQIIQGMGHKTMPDTLLIHGKLSVLRQVDVLRELIRRDLKIQYEGTLLGYTWTMLIPVLHLAIFTFLFKVILAIDIPNFTVFAFIGILSYGWFQSALTHASGTIVDNRDLVLRPNFSASILPVVSVSSTMMHFIFSMPLLILIVILNTHTVPPAILFLPSIMLVQFLLCLGLGYLAAILSILFTDTKHILDVLLRLFYFLSPVFYDPGMVPERFQWLYNLNPLVTLFESYRAILLHGTSPPWSSLGIVALFSMILTWFGWRLFRQRSHRFLEEL